MTGVKRVDRGRGHSYYVDGDKYEGVTTLLGNGLPKPALVNWAANTTAAYAVDHWTELEELSVSARLEKLKKARWDDLDQAARRGTEVHKIAEQLVHGREVDVPDPIAGHVESYVKFLDDFDPQPVLVEAVVANRKWRYAGTLDLVADIDGERWLLDVKTTRSGIFPDVALQLVLYRHAEIWIDGNGDEQSMADLGITRSAAIHVRADGYSLIPLDTTEPVFKDALHVIWCARMRDRMNGWRGDEIEPPQKKDAA